MIIKVRDSIDIYISPRKLEVQKGYFTKLDKLCEIIVENKHLEFNLETVRHKLADQKAFAEPLRMHFKPELKGKSVFLECTLHADNLEEPYSTTLEIIIPQ